VFIHLAYFSAVYPGQTASPKLLPGNSWKSWKVSWLVYW